MSSYLYKSPEKYTLYQMTVPCEMWDEQSTKFHDWVLAQQVLRWRRYLKPLASSTPAPSRT